MLEAGWLVPARPLVPKALVKIPSIRPLNPVGPVAGLAVKLAAPVHGAILPVPHQ